MGKRKDPVEKTLGGSEIVKAGEPEPEVFVSGDPELIGAVDRHIANHIGRIETVWHETCSTYVHIDVHHVPATEERPFQLLVTSGMSSLPMVVPRIAMPYRYGELMMCLPPNWKLSRDFTMNHENPTDWPVGFLQNWARYPHKYRTWLAAGHTMPWDGLPLKFPDVTELNAVLLGKSRCVPDGFFRLKHKEMEICFWSVFLIYQEELDFKLENGSDALLDLFDSKGVTDLLDLQRINAVTDQTPRRARKNRFH